MSFGTYKIQGVACELKFNIKFLHLPYLKSSQLIVVLCYLGVECGFPQLGSSAWPSHAFHMGSSARDAV